MFHDFPAPPPPGMWYELSCLFCSERIVAGEEDRPLPACRVLECRDMHDGRVLERSFVDPPPAALKAREVTGCLKEAFRRHGPPAEGVFISPAAWLSAGELLLTGETFGQGRMLFLNGVDFPAMSRFDREALQEWSASRGLQCGFEKKRTF